MNLLEGIPNERGRDHRDGSAGPMTSDIPELVAAEVADLRRFKAECTRGVLDGYADLPRHEARREGALLMATYAKNRSYSWASLRTALSRHSDLLAQLPDKAGPVNSRPFAPATGVANKVKP